MLWYSLCLDIIEMLIKLKNNKAMNKIFLILIFVTFSNVTFSQNDYYWYKNEKIYLKRNPNKKMILVENISNSTELKNILNISGLKVIKFHSINKGSNIETYNETRENKNINFAIVQSDENNLERLSENSNKTITTKDHTIIDWPYGPFQIGTNAELHIIPNCPE